MAQLSTLESSLSLGQTSDDAQIGAAPLVPEDRDILGGPSFPQIQLIGLPLHGIDGTELIRYVMGESAAARGGYVVTPNIDHLQQIMRHPELREMAMRATVRVADGMPLVWASRLKGTPLPGRVAGSDLIHSLSASLAGSGQSVFLLGGEEGVAERAAIVLSERYPGLEIVGTHCPPFGFEDDPAEMALIAAKLEAARPDHVLLGLPFVKASLLAERLGPVLGSAWFYGLGVSFSFVTGEVQRAPGWMQKTGVEWIHRFIQEPRRLFRRYFVDGLPFAAYLLAVSAGERLGLRREPLLLTR